MSAWRRPETKEQQRDLVAQLIVQQRHAMHLGGDRLQHVLDGLELLASAMHNRVPEQRGRSTSARVTDAKRAEVHRLRADHPDWSQQEIANASGVNIGRVSEILKGKRK
jgi:hypothetical protein